MGNSIPKSLKDDFVTLETVKVEDLGGKILCSPEGSHFPPENGED